MPTVAEFEELQIKVETLTSTYSANIAPGEKNRLNSRYDKDVAPLESDFVVIKEETENALTKVHSLSYLLGKHGTKEYQNFSNEFNTLSEDLKEALRVISDYQFERAKWADEWPLSWGVKNTADWGMPWGLTWLPPAYVTESDNQLSNAREARPHKLSHFVGGSDVVDHTQLSGDVTPDHATIDSLLETLLNQVASLLNRANILSGKAKGLLITQAIHNPFIPDFVFSYWGFGWGSPWAKNYGVDQWGFEWSKGWGITDTITWGERWGLEHNTLEEGLRWPFIWGSEYYTAPEIVEPEPAPPNNDHC